MNEIAEKEEKDGRVVTGWLSVSDFGLRFAGLRVAFACEGLLLEAAFEFAVGGEEHHGFAAGWLGAEEAEEFVMNFLRREGKPQSAGVEGLGLVGSEEGAHGGADVGGDFGGLAGG